jgi:AAA15 family ATPase/GTPase
MKGDIVTWLDHRGWKQDELFNVYCDKKISFTIEFCDDFKNDNVLGQWNGIYQHENTSTHHLFDENMEVGDLKFELIRSTKVDSVKRIVVKDQPSRIIKKLLRIREYQFPNISSHQTENRLVNFKYQGSIFSALEDDDVPQEFYEMRNFILSMESFELLAPHFLRQRTRDTAGSIGLEGKELSSFLNKIGDVGRKELKEQIVKVYPQLQSLDIKKLRAGWKQLDVKEKFQDKEQTISSLHANDGLLRLLAILSQLHSDRKVLLFDEIENGINQELVEFLVEKLVSAKPQIFVTTHSPLFLNYLDEKQAQKSVHYFYKTPEGFTQCVPFFDYPETSDKLRFLGVGEAIADTSLTEFNKVIEKANRTKRRTK